MTNDNTNQILASFLDFICEYIIHDNGPAYCSSRIESFRAYLIEDQAEAIAHLEGNPSLLREIFGAAGAGMPTGGALTAEQVKIAKRRIYDMF